MDGFRQFPSRLFWLIGAIFLGWFGGCGGSDGIDGPAGTVRGSLTYEGRPLAEGFTIVFEQDGGQAFMSTGRTESDGKYVMKTSMGDRMPAGTYKIFITPPLSESDQATPTSPDAYSKVMEKKAETAPEPSAVSKGATTIPDKYLKAETSNLKFEVKDGPNKIDINLTD